MLDNQIMNKSEVQNKEFDLKNVGWTCPKCGKVWNPSVKSCTCMASKQENLKPIKNWIKD